MSESRSSTSSTTMSYGQIVPPARALSIPAGGYNSTLSSSMPNPYSNSTKSVRSSTTSSHDFPQPHPYQHPTPSQPQRTIDDVRNQVAQSIAVRTIRKAKEVDGTKIGVVLTLSSSSGDGTDEAVLRFIKLIASQIKHILPVSSYLFIIGTPGPATPGTEAPILVLSSSPDFLHRASMLIPSKFIGRISTPDPVNASHDPTGKRWVTYIQDLGETAYDEEALWDVVMKCARTLVDPLSAPPGTLGVRDRLILARSKIERLAPQQAYAELMQVNSPWPIVLIDIRPHAQRLREGSIPGAFPIERGVLEWRLDPRGKEGEGEEGGRLSIADRYDLRVIIICQEGNVSSLAVVSLQELGLLNATDVIGGFRAWKAYGLPVLMLEN